MFARPEKAFIQSTAEEGGLITEVAFGVSGTFLGTSLYIPQLVFVCSDFTRPFYLY